MMNPNELKRQRHELKAAAESICDKAMAARKDLCGDELVAYNAILGQSKPFPHSWKSTRPSPVCHATIRTRSCPTLNPTTFRRPATWKDQITGRAVPVLGKDQPLPCVNGTGDV